MAQRKTVAGVRRAHNPKAACSNHAPATTKTANPNTQPTRSFAIAEALLATGLRPEAVGTIERRICELAKAAACKRISIATALAKAVRR